MLVKVVSTVQKIANSLVQFIIKLNGQGVSKKQLHEKWFLYYANWFLKETVTLVKSVEQQQKQHNFTSTMKSLIL
jgi:hypothetical protein